MYQKKRELERIKEIIENISNEKKSIFIVEGKKDIESLIFLGVKKENIISISNKQIDEIRRILMHKKIIDFIDNDKEGIKIQKRLKKYNIYLDPTYKNEIFNILRINRTQDIKKRIEKLFFVF